MPNLNISEIFYSLQGEAAEVGIPTVFIRLIGCPLRCNYCDTEYAFHGKNLLSIDAILTKISHFKTRYICVSGGEPLAQKNCLKLLDELIKKRYKVSLETSGSIDISEVNPKVSIVMDLKTPSSGEESKNRWQNLKLLKKTDQLKFVIASKSDFDWSVKIIKQNKIKAEILFSPVFKTLNPTTLANWILKSQLQVRLQIQLHKFLWGDVSGT